MKPAEDPHDPGTPESQGEAAASPVPSRGGTTAQEVRGVVAPILGRVPRYVLLGARILREPAIRWQHKSLLAFAILWWASPIHYVVNVIPVLGWIDVPAFFLLGMRQALAHCPPEVSARHLKAVGLTPTQAQEDLSALLQVSLSVAVQVGTRMRERVVAAAQRAAGAPPPTPCTESTLSTESTPSTAPTESTPRKNLDLKLAGRVARGFGKRVGQRVYQAVERLAEDEPAPESSPGSPAHGGALTPEMGH